MRTIIPLFLLLAVLLPTTASKADTNADSAILGPTDQHYFSSFHMGTLPEKAVYRSADSQEFLVSIFSTLSNSENYRHNQFDLDAEVLQNSLFASWLISSESALDILVPVITRGSGFLDKPINRWHNYFSLPQGARATERNNRYNLRAHTTDGEIFEGPSQGSGIGVTQLAVKHRLFSLNSFETSGAPARQENGGFALADLNCSLLVGVGLPSYSEDYGQESLDLQLGLLNDQLFEYNDYAIAQLATGVSFTRYLDDALSSSRGSLRYYSEHYAGFAYLTFPAKTSFNFYTGVLVNSAQVANISTFDAVGAYFDFGANISLGKSLLSLGLRENTPHSEITTDVSFILRWETLL